MIRRSTVIRGGIPAALLCLALGCQSPGYGGATSEAIAAPPAGPLIVALGTAQDGGLPHAACDCVRCAAARADPARRRAIAGLALITQTPSRRVYLVDVTPDIREQWSETLRRLTGGAEGRVDRDPVDGVFLTHAHIGHYTGLAFFGFEAVHTTGLPVHCTPRMAGFLRANGPWSRLVGQGNIALEPDTPGSPVMLDDGVTVTSFAVPHRDEFSDTVGYRISGPRRTVLYVPDTDGWERWEPPLETRLSGVDVALLDGTFYSGGELPGRAVESIGHPLITGTMDRLQEVVDRGEVEVRFTHLNHSNRLLGPDPQVRRTLESRGFHVLDDGDVLPL